MIFSVVNFSAYEVATACALALGAEKLICIIDGPILDEPGRLIRFLTLQDADMLIRERAKQSEIAANYVQAVRGEDLTCLAHSESNGSVTSLQKEKGFSDMYAATFHNGVGFENGNGLSGEQGFAIGGQERLSRLYGYLSELAAAAFVCRVSLHLDGWTMFLNHLSFPILLAVLCILILPLFLFKCRAS